jgi:hypothetical protein
MDLATAELIVEHLGSDDPLLVLAAMTALERRGRHRFVPSLILEHGDACVLARALAILGKTARSDWHARARRALTHPAEPVRLAAARALAAHGRLDPEHLMDDAAPVVRGYATVHAALRDPGGASVQDPRVLGALTGRAARAGALAAIADAPPSERAGSLLVALVEHAERAEPGDAAFAELVARATAQQGEARVIPALVAQLGRRAGRESIRAALVALGDRAARALSATLTDTTADAAVRAHVPQSLARFGTAWAAERLLVCIESEPDARVRFKAIGALARVVAEHRVAVDRARVERCARAQLETYFRRLALRVALGEAPEDEASRATHELLTGLLDDKLRQSIERTFRLLAAAHPREDVRRLHAAHASADARARAHASELLEAILSRRDQRALRDAIRIVSDDLSPAEQLRRVRARASARAPETLGVRAPHSRDEALRAALGDPDAKLAAIASLHAQSLDRVRAPCADASWIGAAHV